MFFKGTFQHHWFGIEQEHQRFGPDGHRAVPIGPTPWVHREAIRRFAPNGFLDRMDNLARDSHVLHDQYYQGCVPRSQPHNNRFTVELPPLIQHQFEPIVQHDLKPLSLLEQSTISHLKKSTG